MTINIFEINKINIVIKASLIRLSYENQIVAMTYILKVQFYGHGEGR
jgi:hypothetical protein